MTTFLEPTMNATELVIVLLRVVNHILTAQRKLYKSLEQPIRVVSNALITLGEILTVFFRVLTAIVGLIALFCSLLSDKKTIVVVKQPSRNWFTPFWMHQEPEYHIHSVAQNPSTVVKCICLIMFYYYFIL
jgi:hypothetical protein